MARRIVVVGAGMVGARVVGDLVARGATTGPDAAEVVLLGEERHAPYDRVHLSSYASGASAASLSLLEPSVVDDPRVDLCLGLGVDDLDLAAKLVRLADGTALTYDALVLATGSTPFVPPIAGREREGCFVYRTLDDLDAIRSRTEGARHATVIGGGLLGLEAADAMRGFGLAATVVEFAPRLMPAQLDDGGAALLRREVEALGIEVRVATATASIDGDDASGVTGLTFADGTTLATDLVVFSAGIRPRDDLARAGGLTVGERGGIVVDERCRTSAPDVWAVGECALAHERIWGLVAPGYDMAAVVADQLTGTDASFAPTDLSTRLKLLGVEVASVGESTRTGDDVLEVVATDPVAGVHQRLVLDAAGERLLGAVLVGDTAPYGRLLGMARRGTPVGGSPRALLAPVVEGGGGPADDDLVCTCNNVAYCDLRAAVRDAGVTDVAALMEHTRAGTGCGSCVGTCKGVLDTELEAMGVVVDRSLCPHFAHTRQDLFDLVLVEGLRTFGEVLERHGTGRGAGCATCKPAVASILASLWNEHPLDDAHVGLQDTNDRFLANIQKDGTYSVVPRVPGGEITPAKLKVIAEVAADHDLYTKITGGQRIDLFGARLDELPVIWERLVAAGFESGQAYGKSVRTVKSCVGLTWCRYGVQDSTALAIALEERYRGLRAPHKLKFAVSGCSRECAEAQSKDVGVIATEQGWNLYVAGNGGMTPRHATLLATDLDTATLVRFVDRFLMYYVRTADKLQRTARWLEALDGGIDQVRRVVVDDALGLAATLEAMMARHVGSYADEWAATLADERKLAAFRHFANDDAPDPDLAYARVRGQRQPLPLVVEPPRSRDDDPLLVGAAVPVAGLGGSDDGNVASPWSWDDDAVGFHDDLALSDDPSSDEVP